ncbi:MAG TPA: dienelactone hydrolase family protein, partial [Deltaproteobacteria bacterium]|nr:dienelactone hydrolase family protein [Deltaproteobacteria bacterium]
VCFRKMFFQGFNHFPGRMEKYHQAAAERHWYRILSLFERNLKKLAK